MVKMAIFDVNNLISGNEHKKYALVGTVGLIFSLVFYIRNKIKISQDKCKKIIDLVGILFFSS
jgi:hypothetical protein